MRNSAARRGSGAARGHGTRGRYKWVTSDARRHDTISRMTMPSMDETDERFYAAPSRIPDAGQGLFARVPLRAGDRLAVVGVLVLRDSAADRYTAYADAYKLHAGDYLLIPCGAAAVVNHSAYPNLRKAVDGHRVSLEVLHDVTADEELFIAYSEYAQDRFLPS
jgi:hypothetical protein